MSLIETAPIASMSMNIRCFSSAMHRMNDGESHNRLYICFIIDNILFASMLMFHILRLQ